MEFVILVSVLMKNLWRYCEKRYCEKKKKINCAYQVHQNCNMWSLFCMKDTCNALHGFCQNSYFWDNAIHISRGMIRSLPSDQEGITETSLWDRWSKPASVMGRLIVWVQIIDVILVLLIAHWESKLLVLSCVLLRVLNSQMFIFYNKNIHKH